jgi:hypothetical protein
MGFHRSAVAAETIPTSAREHALGQLLSRFSYLRIPVLEDTAQKQSN